MTFCDDLNLTGVSRNILCGQKPPSSAAKMNLNLAVDLDRGITGELPLPGKTSNFQHFNVEINYKMLYTLPPRINFQLRC